MEKCLANVLEEAGGYRLDHLEYTLGELVGSDHSSVGPIVSRILAPMLRRGNPASCASVAAALLEVVPGNAQLLGQLADAELKLGRADEAKQHVRDSSDAAPQDVVQAARGLQLLLTQRDNEAAAALADARGDLLASDERLCGLALRAFYRAGRMPRAVDCAEILARGEGGSIGDATLAAQALLAVGKAEPALAVLDAAKAESCADPRALFELGRARFMVDRMDPKVIMILEDALDMEPGWHRVLDLLARAHIAHGNPERAVEVLEQIPPSKRSHAAATLLASVLSSLGRTDESLKLWQAAIRKDPDSRAVRRALTAAMLDQGLVEEAGVIYRAGLDRRRTHLPESFAAGLSRILAEPAPRLLRQQRLDWVWGHLEQMGAMPPSRTAWEDEANRIFAIDEFLLDWVECSPERGAEVLDFIDGIAEAEAALEAIRAESRGLFIVGAHVGVIYAGAAAMVATGTNGYWVASMPAIPGTRFANRVISTGGNTDTVIARRIVSAVRNKEAVWVALDGSAARERTTFPFLNRQIPLSTFVPQLIHRRNVPSVFFLGVWNDGRFGLQLTRLPEPQDGQGLDDFCGEWMHSYLAVIENVVREKSVSLRFSGGFWNGINC